MAKFKGADLVREIDKALDKGMARFIANTQSKLSASSPVDTGRLASSWMIGKAIPNRSKPAERAPGTTRIQVEKYDGQIKYDSDYFISSNLPYSAIAAYDPGYVGRAGGGAGDWFSRIVNNLDKDATRDFDFFLRKIK